MEGYVEVAFISKAGKRVAVELKSYRSVSLFLLNSMQKVIDMDFSSGIVLLYLVYSTYFNYCNYLKLYVIL